MRDNIAWRVDDAAWTRRTGASGEIGSLLLSGDVRSLLRGHEPALRQLWTFYATEAWSGALPSPLPLRAPSQQPPLRACARASHSTVPLHVAQHTNTPTDARTSEPSGAQAASGEEAFEQAVADGRGMRYTDWVRFCTDNGIYPGVLGNDIATGFELLSVFLACKQGARAAAATARLTRANDAPSLLIPASSSRC